MPLLQKCIAGRPNGKWIAPRAGCCRAISMNKMLFKTTIPREYASMKACFQIAPFYDIWVWAMISIIPSLMLLTGKDMGGGNRVLAVLNGDDHHDAENPGDDHRDYLRIFVYLNYFCQYGQSDSSV